MYEAQNKHFHALDVGSGKWLLMLEDFTIGRLREKERKKKDIVISSRR
jgi:hypothetical protein